MAPGCRFASPTNAPLTLTQPVNRIAWAYQVNISTITVMHTPAILTRTISDTQATIAYQRLFEKRPTTTLLMCCQDASVDGWVEPFSGSQRAVVTICAMSFAHF